jgi:hypothetical protein
LPERFSCRSQRNHGHGDYNQCSRSAQKSILDRRCTTLSELSDWKLRDAPFPKHRKNCQFHHLPLHIRVRSHPEAVSPNVGYADPLGCAKNDFYCVSRPETTFSQYRGVPTRKTTPNKEGDNIRPREFDLELVAGTPWLRHLQRCAADSKYVSNADIFFREAIRRDVFAEAT